MSLRTLLVLLILFPLVELALLIWLGGVTRWWIPILLVIVTGAVGATLARWQGVATFQRIQDQLAQGQLPGAAMLDAVLIFLAGALLLTPGMLTDVIGLLLLVPFTRWPLRNRLLSWLKKKFIPVDFSHAEFYQDDYPPEEYSAGEGSEIIDSYVVGHSEDEEEADDEEDCREE